MTLGLLSVRGGMPAGESLAGGEKRMEGMKDELRRRHARLRG
jgi:hypothetical protein